jgi:hypothetical protein
VRAELPAAEGPIIQIATFKIINKHLAGISMPPNA